MSHFRSKGLSLLALAGLMAAPQLPLLAAESAVPQAAALPCVDRVSYSDNYALVKANNKPFFHASIRNTGSGDWISATDNLVIGTGDTLADVDLMYSYAMDWNQASKAKPGEQVIIWDVPVGAVAVGNKVYLHDNLLDQERNDWREIPGPWTEPITSVVIGGHPGAKANNDPFIINMAVSTEHDIYYYGNIYNVQWWPNQKIGTSGWVKITKNGPQAWGNGRIEQIGMTVAGLGARTLSARVGGTLYVLAMSDAALPIYGDMDKTIEKSNVRWVAMKPVLYAEGNREVSPGVISSDSLRMAAGNRVYSMAPTNGEKAESVSRDITGDLSPLWGDNAIADLDMTQIAFSRTRVRSVSKEDTWQMLAVAGNQVWRYHNAAYYGLLDQGWWQNVTDNLAQVSGCAPAGGSTDLSLQVTAPESVRTSNIYLITPTVTNRGQSAASGGRVTISVPDKFTYYPHQPARLPEQAKAWLANCKFSPAVRKVMCDVGTLRPGESKTIPVPFLIGVRLGSEDGYDFIATAQSASVETNPTDNSVAFRIRNNKAVAACLDGKDNNGDGMIDHKDPLCKQRSPMFIGWESDAEAGITVPTVTFTPQGQQSSQQASSSSAQPVMSSSVSSSSAAQSSSAEQLLIQDAPADAVSVW